MSVRILTESIGLYARCRACCLVCPWRSPWVTTRPAWPDQHPRPIRTARRIAITAAERHLRTMSHRSA